MNQAGGPFYTLRGARPRPTATGEPDRSSWRATVILAAVMMGWMLLVVIVAVAVSPLGLNGNTAVSVGRGVTVTPPAGWTRAAAVWDVGPNAVTFQKAGVVVVFGADAYSGSREDLLDTHLTRIRGQFDSFRSLPAAELTVAGDLRAVGLLFSGSGGSGQLEGELVAASHQGTGIVMLAVAPVGQLRRTQADLDDMLSTMTVAR